MPATRQHFELTAASEVTALELLKQTGLRVSKLKQAASNGAIWLSTGSKPKRLRRLKQSLEAGDKVYLYYDPEIIDAEVLPANCIYDGHTYSIWSKPRGMFSQGSKWGDANSISRYVELALNRPTYLVHRLDRMTAGLMILCHKKSGVKFFTNQFEQRTIVKHYCAVVTGRLSTNSFTIDEPLDNKKALSIIKSTDYDELSDQSLVEIQIKTGRKHQIRRHLAGLGNPIVGDRLYGSDRTETPLQLCAVELSLDVPDESGKHSFRLTGEEIANWLNAWTSR